MRKQETMSLTPPYQGPLSGGSYGVLASPPASGQVSYLALTKCSLCANAVLDPAQLSCEVRKY